MGEKKFTFIELHLDGDTQFGPRAIDDALPFGEQQADEDDEFDDLDDEAEEAADDDSGGKGAIGAVIALVVLVALGVAAKKYASDDDEADAEEFPEADEPDVIIN